MRILITGSSGVIGSALCKKLSADGIDVVPFDLKQGCDIRDKEHLSQTISGVDGVIHCAAVSRVDDCEKAPGLCRDVNVIGTQNVVECMREQSNNPWLLFVSSREVYGQAEHLPVTEEYRYDPINEYAVSKVEGEKIVARYHNSGVIRLTNVYGAANDYKSRVVLAFAKAAVKNKPLLLNGANNILDFVHIDDAVNGIVKYLNRREHETIHLASGVGITLEQLAGRVISLAKSNSAVVKNAASRNTVSRFCGCSNKAKRLLGWQARVSLEQGIEKLIKEIRR